MAEAKVPPKTVHLSIRVSEDLWLLMQQLIQKGGHANINEFVRTCIRAYVDETGDVIGSRRHFNNRLAERMDRLEALILWNSYANIAPIKPASRRPSRWPFTAVPSRPTSNSLTPIKEDTCAD